MKNLKYIIYTVLLLGLISLLLIFSNEAKQGAAKGIKLCTNIIIPSLLPMIIICGTITKSKCSKIIELTFSPFSKIVRLPSQGISSLVLGMIGGYPMGAILTSDMYKNGIICKCTAQKMMRFNFCGGVAFIITAVGTVWLNSTKLGVVLYLINILSNLIICLFSRFDSKGKATVTQNDYYNFDEAVIESVNQAVSSVSKMCVYIILFSAILNIVTLPSALSPILEITNGIFTNGKLKFEYLAAALSFGGLCIHFQILQYIKDVKMKYTQFFMWRLASGAISYFLGKIYTILFPQSFEVFSNISSVTPKAFEVNIWLSIVLLFGCVALVIELNQKKSKLI